MLININVNQSIFYVQMYLRVKEHRSRVYMMKHFTIMEKMIKTKKGRDLMAVEIFFVLVPERVEQALYC